VFEDMDLADNLFDLAPLLNSLEGSTATFTSHDCTIAGPAAQGCPTIFYGMKRAEDNTWRFSLPKPQPKSAHTVVRHETHTEIVLYASAVFGNPTFNTFVKAMRNGWLSNYPDLTLQMLNSNKLHTPATALDHITAARS
jgi:hypothetical protein